MSAVFPSAMKCLSSLPSSYIFAFVFLACLYRPRPGNLDF